MMLRAENLGWTVRNTAIVSEVSLSVREGEMLGILGPNGSGKSTLMKMLAGILAPSSGTVTLKGQPMAAMPRRAIAQILALVEQHAGTAERITVQDAVELGRTPWLSAIEPWSPRDNAIVAQALADVDMAGMTRRHWHTLSGGEQQRVHLARALAQQPTILLLDEPTNHLDIEHQLAILGLVRALPITTVVALHDLNQAMNCDRVAVLDGGRLVQIGPPAEVLTAQIMRDVFNVRASFLVDPEDGSRVIRFQPLGLPAANTTLIKEEHS
ncbi:ABC transporter ATP-binding protein [Tianweitania sp. BSSL-BM11]|uniref:ABC transporter ATP-binding protein n=1 Tax=Tianweitania aestuarii TaxID=2814886 RepID=A0ABS5RS04_9HYPH|nr:ABC transporter ATP-binding protein [Tianweitania aestuarii]MBS9719585.1 ABC transporter ATP-binding protein [Tianweitania aestuarii]